MPIKFATKTYRGLKMWKDTIYLDTPQRFEKVKIAEEYHMPGVTLGSIMVTVNDWENNNELGKHPFTAREGHWQRFYKRTRGG